MMSPEELRGMVPDPPPELAARLRQCMEANIPVLTTDGLPFAPFVRRGLACLHRGDVRGYLDCHVAIVRTSDPELADEFAAWVDSLHLRQLTDDEIGTLTELARHQLMAEDTAVATLRGMLVTCPPEKMRLALGQHGSFAGVIESVIDKLGNPHDAGHMMRLLAWIENDPRHADEVLERLMNPPPAD